VPLVASWARAGTLWAALEEIPSRSAAMRLSATLGEQRRKPATWRTSSLNRVSDTRCSPDPGSGGGECGRRRKSTSQERISAEVRHAAIDSGTRNVTVVISKSGKL
jgi:hypothetical protein